MKLTYIVTIFASALWIASAQDNAPRPSLRSLKLKCNSDDDCSEKQFCSGGFCLAHGSCSSLFDCQNPSNRYKTPKCIGPLQCKKGICGRECTGDPCLKGPEVRCLTIPCDTTQCDESHESCVNDYCGGCTALFFNAKGEQVCAPEKSASCSSDKDCDIGAEYCADGKCMQHGACNTILDCKNPSNLYPSLLCEGSLICEKGLCGMNCNGSPCPDGQPVNCFAEPCSVTKCDKPWVTCLNDYCGGCNAIFLDDAGGQVCLSEKVDTASKCVADKDCNVDTEFCADGKCMAHGSCKSVTDCENPSNLYPSILCEGPLTCEEGICGKNCTGGQCPDGRFVKCPPDPCSLTKCDEPYTTCKNDYCGGCKAIFMNDAGVQVCDSETVNTASKCVADKDCNIETEFCADGKCMAHGSCNSVADCENPSNSYISVLCEGPLTCVDGFCGRDCAGGPCAAGTPLVQCKAEPCSVNTCDEPYTTCKNDYCGGCHAIFMNDAGVQVCVPKSSKTCSADEDCDMSNEYCTDGTCTHHGSCNTVTDCENPSNVFDSGLCDGPLSCDDGRCRKQCRAGQCPDGRFVKCPADPCSLTKCDEPYTTCKNDYCGGCKAIFLNDVGDQVCTSASDQGIKCSSDSDCDQENEFCSGGECRAHGTCSTIRDCQNPANRYSLVKCMGYLTCTKGLCGLECSGTPCSDGDQVNCASQPCKVTACDEPYESCVDNYCGGCNAIFFNARGENVCSSQDTVTNDVSCKTNEDCADSQFCSGGICRAHGSCANLLDCQNPSNKFDVQQCTGFLSCEQGTCNKQCSNSTCPGTQKVMNCLETPCDVLKCDEPHEYCINDYCGGCKALFISASGDPVCKAKDLCALPEQSCRDRSGFMKKLMCMVNKMAGTASSSSACKHAVKAGDD